jgi:hypothetical protein
MNEKNIDGNCKYTEEKDDTIKCKNYELCNSLLPEWWFECKGNYLCTDCHMMFGTWGSGENLHTGKGILEINNNIYCPICLECKKGISQPRCEHFICIDCFTRCYYGNTDEKEPIFPYPDIEDEYYDDQKNIKWENDYPLIKTFHEEWNNWDDKRMEKYDNEEYLRICPMCRK